MAEESRDGPGLKIGHQIKSETISKSPNEGSIFLQDRRIINDMITLKSQLWTAMRLNGEPFKSPDYY